ncbi:MAG: peptide chain release factor 2 [Prevotella sp.]|nr:peptide chain release factor 2 [Prevotella sp.]MBQ6956880.1 peptide chain release factor 2 [Bacteroidales bacterium]
MTIPETVKDLDRRKESLKKFLDIDNLLVSINEEEKKTEAADFWNDPKEAKKVMLDIKSKKTWTSAYKAVSDSCDDMMVMSEFFEAGDATEEEMLKQIETTTKLVEELEFKNMLRNESDRLDAVLSINAGAGGVEAQDWAEMLMRMYIRYAERTGYKVAISNSLDGDGAGIKSVTMQIEGDFAYGYLKSETGVHRLVRVSPFNAQGKRMTSFASVSVTPLVDDTIEVVVDQSRLSWDTFRSGGAGGQNVNKVESGVRLRYQYKDPYTGEEEEILIENTETRDQPKNKENALRLLRSQLYDREMKHRMEEQAKIKASQKKIEWGSQIRSYVMDDRRVKDHRTGYQTGDVTGVMDGKIDEFIKAFLMQFGAEA